MKKVLVCILVLVLCLTAFVACDPKTPNGPSEPSAEIKAAKQTLDVKYKDAIATTTGDFEVMAVVVAQNKTFNVEWTANVTTGAQDAVTVADGSEGMKKIVVKYSTSDVKYELTAKIKGEGEELSVTYKGTVPKVTAATVAQFLEKSTEDTTVYAISGVVVATGGSHEKTGSFVVEDSTGAIFSYNKFKVEKGDKVMVVGTRDVNNGVPQIATTAVVVEGTQDYTPQVKQTIAAKDLEIPNKDNVANFTGKYLEITGVYPFEDNGYVNGAKTQGGEKAFQLYFDDATNTEVKKNLNVETTIYGYCRGCGSGYITIQVSAIKVTGQALTDEQKVDMALSTLKLNKLYNASFELPTSAMAEVTWAVKSGEAEIKDGKVEVTATATPKTIVLVATAKSGEVTKQSEDFTVTVVAEDTAVHTVAEIVEIIKAQENPKETTAAQYTVKGLVIKSKYSSNNKNFEIYLATPADADYEFEVYRGELAKDITGDYTADDALVGKWITARGFLQQYNTIYEIKHSGNENPQITKIENGTDAELVEAVKNSLKVAGEATADLKLPATQSGVGITWVSNNTAVLANDGKVTRGAEDVTVTLTATLKLNEATANKEFTVKVLGDSVAMAQYIGTTTTNMKADENNATLVGLDAEKFVVTSVKNDASNEVGLNKDGTIRLYNKEGSTNGEALKIEMTGTITRIKVVFEKNGDKAKVMVNDTEVTADADGYYTINASSFTIQNISNVKSTQVWISQIEIEVAQAA